jgi:hypothetical protein
MKEIPDGKPGSITAKPVPKCFGERTVEVVGTGRSSYNTGFHLGFSANEAWGRAKDAADAALAANLPAAQAEACKDLCSTGCKCAIELERMRFFSGDPKVYWVPRTTHFGFGWGGTYTITRGWRVIAKCVPE